jgi:hypothetical protein
MLKVKPMSTRNLENCRSQNESRIMMENFVSVGDPDPHVFGPPESGPISPRNGSGSFTFLIKGVEGTEIMLAK